MEIASFTTNSIVRLACCSILVSPQRMGWSSVQAYSAIADLFMKPLMHVSFMLFQTCFKLTCRLADVHLSTGARYFVDDVCLLLHREVVFDFSEEREWRVDPDLNTTLMSSLYTPSCSAH